ncbi:SPOSA6832_04129 [Sporobolomyces salmonicolor]|uniref:SPOSA6832_04129-mRNA-1:cds n=1 Tax=Sporidiobolus salmonicolor TaxID=5005 RepID=A0A0D6ER71_SPOSA|nr:SPOSA6832_04129 [Sporobolomyces salmonicolor]
MQLRIDTLEAQLAILTNGANSSSSIAAVGPSGAEGDGSTSTTPALLSLSLANGNQASDGVRRKSASPMGGSGVDVGPATQSFIEKTAPQVNPNPDRLDTFQGGLALNAHGELRFYVRRSLSLSLSLSNLGTDPLCRAWPSKGPTSSYRAVLADSTSILNTPTTVHAIRAFSLTRAPIPTAAPADPALPRRPPDLSPDFKAKLFSLAFEYCFAHYNIVPERPFYADLQMYPYERTQHYSPFLMNLVLAVGCRYLDPDEDYPPEICGLIGDPDTRGDVFITWSRYLLDQEWYNPAESTIRGLLVLGLYMAGRGFDGPCFVFVRLAQVLTEDFGLHLGGHRLSMGLGVGVGEPLLNARRDTFWNIGRSISFSPDEIDISPPTIVPEFDFDAPLYRSSAFHWASRLIFIGSKILTTVYSLKPGISLGARQATVPELHLLLESWCVVPLYLLSHGNAEEAVLTSRRYHALPSHLRASGSDPTKAPHPHIIVLNCVYHLMHIGLHRPYAHTFFSSHPLSTTQHHSPRCHSFFRRHSSNPSTNISTDKCLFAASSIVRLVKLLKNTVGLRKAAPGIQHSAFNAGTILAISAVEDGISDNAKQDVERRVQAKKDLKFIVASLKEIGVTWTTAHTSAGVLEALMQQWEVATSHASQQASSSSSSSSSQPSGLTALGLDLARPSPSPHLPHSASELPKLEDPSYPSSNPVNFGAEGSPAGSVPMGLGTGAVLGLGLGGMYGSRPGTAAGSNGSGSGGGEPSFGASLPFMFPSCPAPPPT